MTNEEKIVQALEALQADVKEVKQGQTETNQHLSNLEEGQREQGPAIKQQGLVINHIATAIKALATKQDVERVQKEVDTIKKRLWPHRAD